MKKVIMLVFWGILVISCSQKHSQDLEWIPFVWESGDDWGKYIEKMAIYVPVTIDELPYKFTMQLDLGTYTTVFNKNTFKPFLEKYPSLNNKVDRGIWIKNVNLKLGKVSFSGIDVGLYPQGKELSLDSINAAPEIEIGVVGADLFQDKVVIIDYKSNKLAITDSVPIAYQNVSFVIFETYEGLIKLPFRINGNMEYLLFDTGASYFSLATTKQNALAIGGTQIIDSLRVSTWGDRWISFYGLETVVPVAFGDKNMGKSIVYYTESEGFDDLYSSLNIWGLTGNGFFLNDMVVIDYKHNRFGIQ
jgi:hypothetical protein